MTPLLPCGVPSPQTVSPRRSSPPRRWSRRRIRPLLRGSALLVLLAAPGWQEAAAQTRGRDAVASIRVRPLRFDAPEPREERLSNGVTVFHLEDHSLPLVNVYARFSGGYARFPREYYAPGTALPVVLRSGGTSDMPPDSVERVLERYAVQSSFGGSGESVFSSINTLTEHLDIALDVWGRMLRQPGFDTARVAIWRGQELESARRRRDNPGRLAFSEFNRLMYGDHPVGWEMEVADLAPPLLTPDRFRWLQARILCPEQLILGVTGDVSWGEIEPLLERMMEGWPSCAEPLPESPPAEVGATPGVYLIPRPVNQSTVVLAHPTDIRQDDSRDYFASRIGNAILGAGGFTSRLLNRVRTEEGLAYGASSIWTTPRRYDGLLGATTRTRSETTVPAIRLILETMEEMAREEPTEEEVATTIDESVNGFVFNFDSPGQIVARRMAYRAAGLSDDWLEDYLRGIQRVEPAHVRSVFRRHLRTEDMVILVVGDPEGMTEPLEALGPVTLVEIAEVGLPDPGTVGADVGQGEASAAPRDRNAPKR
ncbi:MAG: insulinase family protein [Gemmatimonadales bacterium]|nr:MAG: insulinase family protein [Gemmatimonadales bacterium]